MRHFWFVPDCLPIAPRPHGDELISSWLRRVAAANWLSVGELLDALRETDQNLPILRNAEFCLPDPWRSRLATLARLPTERIHALELRLRFPHVNPGWFTHHAVRGPAGSDRPLTLILPVCAECCARDDAPPLSRADSCFAFQTHCPRHLTPLVDHCGRCGHIGLPGHGFSCEQCQASLRPTHCIPNSSGTEIIARLESDLLASLVHGRAPSRFWIGTMSAGAFVNLIAELITVVLLRSNIAGERHARHALADLLTPDEFDRRYNLSGGRFDRLHFPALPWFARFKVMAALTQLLLGDRGQ